MMLAVVQPAEPTTDSDARLMRLAGSGDPRAQRLLAHRLAPRVRRVAHRLLSNRADADDAAQQALLEILRAAGGWAERSSVERWADRITIRTSLRLAREQRKQAFSLGGLLELEPLTRSERPARIEDETPRKLQAYLAHLAPARREVLVLKHAMGYTTEEIAELIDKPVGTVKDRLVAARKQLRKLIQRELRIGARSAGGSDG